jgi:hypothetical protein
MLKTRWTPEFKAIDCCEEPTLAKRYVSKKQLSSVMKDAHTRCFHSKEFHDNILLVNNAQKPREMT